MQEKHGQGRRGARTKAYQIWTGIRKRCKSHPRYAGRGISLCDRWDDFKTFFADMGPPKPHESIERIDNERGYEPQNCRWATMAEQARNRRSCRMIHYLGRTQCMTLWAREFGMAPGTLLQRLENGWSVKRALTERVRHGRSKPRVFVRIQGVRRSLMEWCRITGVPAALARHRIGDGWPASKAVSVPKGPYRRAA